jgi:hypothetical protein
VLHHPNPSIGQPHYHIGDAGGNSFHGNFFYGPRQPFKVLRFRRGRQGGKVDRERVYAIDNIEFSAIPADLKQQMLFMARFYFSAYEPILRLLVRRALALLQSEGGNLTPKAALFAVSRKMNLPPRLQRGSTGKLTRERVHQFVRRQQKRLPDRRVKRHFRQHGF